MVTINWQKEYKREFSCLHCIFRKQVFIFAILLLVQNGLHRLGTLYLHNYVYYGPTNLRLDGTTLRGSVRSRRFICCNVNCQKIILDSVHLSSNYFKNILAAYGFACPNQECDAKQMRLEQFKGKKGKNYFRCNVCRAGALESIDLTDKNLSKYACQKSQVKPFIFENEEWDLRAINPLLNDPPRNLYMVYFNRIDNNCLKRFYKKYIYSLCKLNKSYWTISGYLTSFKHFSKYLAEKNILNIEQINRDLTLDFIAQSDLTNTALRNTLIKLRQFFTKGNIEGWFQTDTDLIRDSDIPKVSIHNPDPIPDTVREQIEQKLHKLPDPIARMWIICFFAAMRPGELALLKKNCLEQAGENWKLVWDRKKGQKFHQHSVPITTTIAKVVQEQRKYIEQLWGQDWKYLFCHYHNLSQSDPTHPQLKPVKKKIPLVHSPLQNAILTLIKAENILDDNRELAKFKPCLIRETRLTELFLKGHDLSVVSAWAGHKRLATTANFYTQISCEQIEKEAGHIQSALVNAEGKRIYYESLPKSFWDNPVAHELKVSGTHVNTPIYGYCGLDLDEECDKFRACYTCRFFVAKPEKLSQYIELRNQLREKQEQALANGHSVLVEQFARQANQLDKIILSLQEGA